MRTPAILRRLLLSLPLAVAIVLLVFVLLRLLPGDPVDIIMGQGGNVSEEQIRVLQHQMGLDRPLPAQLGTYLKGLLHGDLGKSLQEQRPVAVLIRETLPATVDLSLAALLLALAVALPVGVVSAVRQRSAADRVAMVGAFLGISMPPFWLGLVLMLFFSVDLHWLPTSGRLDPGLHLARITGSVVLDALLQGDWPALGNALAHLVLPAVTLGAELTAILARVVRSSMVEVLRQEYIQVARAKGLAEGRVVVKHALRNALLPTVTILGLQMGALMGGNMIVETVFGWPGLGRLVVGAIFARDYPVVQGAVLVYALTFLLANLMVDVTYTLLNPRIRL